MLVEQFGEVINGNLIFW